MVSALVLFASGLLLAAGGALTGVRPGWVQAIRATLDSAAAHVAAAVADRVAPKRPGGGLQEFCASMAAELRAGAAPEAALLVVAGPDHRLVPRARTAALLGGDVAQALADDADRAMAAGQRHASALRAIAACWRVSADSGAGLADGLDAAAQLAAAGQRVADDLAAEVAAPRATARILALLPLLGMLLGEVLGARPMAWLTGTPLGLGCLSLGVAFMGAGWLWSRRIIRAALPHDAAAGP